ncbi:PHD finger protein ALFIN-LIKE 6-like [Gigantopelta aegis]|uniref:PHD finger protein ALFIN-LIKE 6-like n=1 Tax=Gigantopelta aegis TaxID=1735272 RepID=UPI001B888EC7|nr:PHD finger protein ALFIN-LIKE 6-like [Gigantopelta aegis]
MSVPLPSTSTESTDSSQLLPSTSPSALSSPPHSIKDFLLKQLTPQFAKSSRGRSARVQRFRYGESLTTSECIERTMEENARKEVATRGRGAGRKGKGRGKTSASSTARNSIGSQNPQPSTSRRQSRSRSPIGRSDDDDDVPCNRCGLIGESNSLWVQCDLCDSWYHALCAGVTYSAVELEEIEWICDFCHQ